MWRKSTSHLLNRYFCYLYFKIEPLLIHKIVPKVLGYRVKVNRTYGWSLRRIWFCLQLLILTKESIPFHCSCLSALNLSLLIIRIFSFSFLPILWIFFRLICKIELHQMVFLQSKSVITRWCSGSIFSFSLL